jgi:hypothetical protein
MYCISIFYIICFIKIIDNKTNSKITKSEMMKLTEKENIDANMTVC